MTITNPYNPGVLAEFDSGFVSSGGNMFGLFVFLITLQTEINVSNHLSREDCLVAASAIQKSEDVQSVRCEFFKHKSVEEGF